MYRRACEKKSPNAMFKYYNLSDKIASGANRKQVGTSTTIYLKTATAIKLL